MRSWNRTAFRLWLLACAGCASTFAYGFHRPHGLHYSNDRLTVEVLAARGRLWFGHHSRASDPWTLSFVQGYNRWDYLFRVGGTASWGRLGFGHSTGPASRSNIVILPYWAIAVALAAPAPLFLRRRRLKALRDPICSHCGYDLRATPDRCPECGLAPVPASTIPMPSSARPNMARWAMTAGTLSTVVALSELYLNERRIGSPPAVATLQLALAVAALLLGVLSLGPDTPRAVQEGQTLSANAVAGLAVALALLNFGCVCGLLLPRLNY